MKGAAGMVCAGVILACALISSNMGTRWDASTLHLRRPSPILEARAETDERSCRHGVCWRDTGMRADKL